ncbi:MAG TPA: bifunctional UDP-N-acetylglucosamine diphosphorylase/glucosamine-1-phosphate N-acetyltransferase GlmU [Anaerolineaceae bacterium]
MTNQASTQRITAIILAAGQGTRMHSTLPKVLHPIAGQPMIEYALQTAHSASSEIPVVVVSRSGDEIREAVGARARFAVQDPQLGTGHAVQSARPLLDGKTDLVLVTYADMPMMTGETLQRLLADKRSHSGPISMLTVMMQDPHGFGRILRGPDGSVTAIMEEAQATREQLAIRELNVGAYCFDARWLWQALERLPLSPKGEYYLTDVVGIAAADGLPVQAVQIDDPIEVLGVNTRVHLAEAEKAMRRRINEAWMLAGVTLIDPETTYIEPGVKIGSDTVIWPNSYLRGKTLIGGGCVIGPNTILHSTQVGSHCTILSSVLEEALLEDHVSIGPFGHLRKGAHLGKGVHLGNFGEVKNSYLAPGVKMGHFSYIGDAQIGADVNIGCGTITCNFSPDGKKNRTEVGEGAFIGSDTLLVAPVTVGSGAITGSGSVVTHDVKAHTVVVGVPARFLKKLEDGN